MTKSLLLPFNLILLLCFAPGILPAGQYGFLTYTEDATSIRIVGCDTSATGDLVIPAFINGKRVSAIGSQAFVGCIGLSGITMPDSIASIGSAVFAGCSSLTSMQIPASVAAIGNNPFLGCTQLLSIEVDEDNLFFSSTEGVLFDKETTSILAFPAGRAGHYSIPATVTSIGNSAFSGSIKLTGITIPDNVTAIGNSAFRSCINLTGITIPDAVTSIGNYAFLHCRSLTSIAMPNDISSISDGLFYGCNNLTSVTLPDGLTSIGSNAFYECSSLVSIVIPEGRYFH